MYRWKETVRSKGGFYTELAASMDELHSQDSGVGADMVAAAITGLNEVILHMHKARQTLNQIVMFTFADMMTAAEVGAAFCAKAARLNAMGDPESAFMMAMSRVFARKVVGIVSEGSRRCATGLLDGSDAEALQAAETLVKGIEARFPLALTAGQWNDMTKVADVLKAMD